jgi:hypothetical protein
VLCDVNGEGQYADDWVDIRGRIIVDVEEVAIGYSALGSVCGVGSLSFLAAVPQM